MMFAHHAKRTPITPPVQPYRLAQIAPLLQDSRQQPDHIPPLLKLHPSPLLMPSHTSSKQSLDLFHPSLHTECPRKIDHA